MILSRWSVLCAVALVFSGLITSHAANPPTPESHLLEIKKLADGLQYKQGEVTLKNGLAKINVPAEFKYLDPADTDTVLTKIWGNPPTGQKTLGMLVPSNAGPADADGWGVIITYDEDGYVKDDDAAKIDYNKLLKDMKAGTAEASKEREKKGYPPISLVGWATPPRYDAVEKKMYWAKELEFGDSADHTLNYNIRILGRRGVLVLNAVSSMEQFPDIEKVVPSILATVNFQEGHRYADFNPSTDKVATYGLAALVAGGVLAKGGFFKVLLGGILAAKKFVIIGVVALLALAKKIFGGRKSEGA
jgi:uncharacterized membrane-anchored protein